MKTHKYISVIGMIVLFLLISTGCIEEVKVHTQFFPDGSCKRVITFKADDDNVDWSEFSVPVDSTWTISMKKDSADSSKYLFAAEKLFASYDSINRDYSNKPHKLQGVERHILYEKKFRWFYTFYAYEEKVQAVYNKIPITNFMTEEEYHFIISDEEEQRVLKPDLDSTRFAKYSEDIEEKEMRWFYSSLFKELYEGLLKVAETGDVEMLTKKKLSENKDSLYHTFLESSDPFDTWDYFERMFEDNKIDTLRKTYPHYFSEYNYLESMLEKLLGMKEYENIILMPGELYDSNSKRIENNQVRWMIKPENFFARDFVMAARSKVTNTWTFILSGIVVLLVIVLWITGRKKRT